MQNIKRFLSLALALVLVLGMVPATVFAAEATPALPTATVSKITQEDLTFAMNFKVDSITEEQLNHYGSWYADFELTVNTDVVFNNDGSADGWLAGQYDAWSENWVTVPFGKYAPVTVKANEPLKIMAFAAELMDEPGLKYTYKEVYDSVKDFDCGVFFDNEFLAANPDLEVKLELKMYNPENESENYVIGETYIYNNPIIAKNTTTNEVYSGVTEAMMAAKEGETVILLKDAAEAMVSVFAGATLDLNGNALAANYMSCFGDIIDSSADNSGLLAVSADRMMIREDNAQMPVHNGNGYKFAEVLKIATAMASEYKFAFQPRFEPGMLELLKQGTATTGVTIQVQVSWKQGNGERTQKFVYNDSHVQKYLNSYDDSTDKYGDMFTLTLNGAANFEELTFTALAVSNTKVNVSSDDLRPQKPAGNVTTDANNQVVNDVTIGSGNASALVPSGTQLESGTNNVTLNTTVIEGNESNANITLGEGEQMVSMDVHVEGVAANNTKPIIVTLTNLAIEGLNEGNIALYHVENGETVAMTRVYSLEEVDAHNEYYYDIATGTITMALATFSEVAVVSNEINPWNGDIVTDWYNDTDTSFLIYNADQLAGLGAIVGGMNGQTQDSFAGQTITLMADIDLNDVEGDGKIFYPIGYWNNTLSYNKASGKVTVDGVETAVSSGFYTFQGAFDGNGHTIKNFYQNTWEMFGDYNDGYSGTPNHYRDGMGLFGKVYGGTVKNLTIEKFTSDGEFTTTGCIAAYADCGATFENITIFDCNPRVYNIGNGGIVGCVGWYAKETATDPVTFRNITVDNTNKISALWGSWDVACGGIVGQYYPTSGQTVDGVNPASKGIYFENCHVAAQIDVYNDVCANYQYYAYRYAGMLIGSVRENVTIDGHSYPKMDGITASGCTVHFGDWNDYYYCELVANSLASYTHDHQMSRLTQVKSVDVENKTVTDLDGKTTAIPTSGRYNYVVVEKYDEQKGTWVHGDGSEYATCYHFVDGEVWTHDKGGYEEKDIDGDGEIDNDVLKEDKQLIYREFNQLFTGYGWGVTSKGITDFAGVENMDIQLSDNEKSVVKFEKADTAKDAYTTETTVTINELFRAVADLDVAIDTDNVQVFVSPANETSTAGGTYTTNTEDWTQGTLTLSGTGAAYITITDYYYCTPTTVTVNVTERQPEVKFESKFTGDFLYRVGNKNTVSLDSLFKAKDDVTIGTVSVTIETVTGASGTYTPDATWTNGTIQFSGTGVVKVTISDNDYCTPTVLTLEVVDAVNATTATNATANNVVLLNNVSGGFSVSGGHTLYGNDFTVTLPTTVQSKYTAGYVGYVTITDGNLDNVRIVGPTYPEMYIYIKQAQDSTDETKANYFYNSILINGGNCTISNSYISGSRSAICIRGGNNVTIENTTVFGGAYANIHIAGASSVTLKDLTTIQTDVTDSYSAGKTAHGLGIAVDSAVVDLYIEGELNQYNWLCEEQWNAAVPSDYQSSFPDFFGNSKYSKYWHYLNGGTAPYVNLTFIFACNWDTERIHDNRTTVDYETCDSTIAGVAGGVYAKVNTVGGNAITNSNLEDPGYTSNGFNPVAPVFKFDNTANDDADDADDAADTYCVYDADSGILKIGVTGSSKVIDLSGVSVSKSGAALAYTVYLNGTQINGTSVTIDAANVTTQTLTFKATSNDAGYDKDGNPIAGSIEYTWTVTVEVAVLAYPAPVWDMGEDYQFDTSNCYYVYYSTSQGYGEAVPIYEGIKITYYDKAGTPVNLDLSGTITLPTGSANSNSNAFTYTLADGSVLKMEFSSGWKSGATTHEFTTYNDKVYIYPQSLDNDNYVRAKTTNQDFNVQISYTFTDPNGQSTGEQIMQWYNAAASNGSVSTVQWKTFDSTNGKKASVCVTGDTLVTLADGTQKEIQYVAVGEEIIVWNFYTGQYEIVPAVLAQVDAAGTLDVLHLYFEDGTELKVLGEHGILDADLNNFIFIDQYDVEQYLGHSFVKMDGDSYSTVKLVDYKITSEETQAYTILSAYHYNAMLEGMFTVTPAHIGDNFFNPFTIHEGLKYNEDEVQADIEKYGLYTYEDFADYVTYEQFVALKLDHFKISVGKGLVTYEGLIYLIKNFVNR